VAICRSGTKTLVHPEAGMLDLDCRILRPEGIGQLLVVFTAAPGSRAAGQLRELSVVHTR
jgi:MmyB-like transcription regulator ligand binding domain